MRTALLSKSLLRAAALLVLLLVAPGCRATNGWIMNNSGLGYLEKGNPGLARREFYRAVVSRPMNPNFRHNLAYAMILQGDVAGAEQVLRHNLTINPMHQPTYHTLSELLIRQNRQPEALSLTENWAGAAPYLPESHVELAWVHRQLGDLPGAEQQLRQALQVQPNHPIALAHLGDVYQQTGHHDRAAMLYQQSLASRWDQPAVQSRLAAISGGRINMNRMLPASGIANMPLPAQSATGMSDMALAGYDGSLMMGSPELAMNSQVLNGQIMNGQVMMMPGQPQMGMGQMEFASHDPAMIGMGGFDPLQNTPDPVMGNHQRRRDRRAEQTHHLGFRSLPGNPGVMPGMLPAGLPGGMPGNPGMMPGIDTMAQFPSQQMAGNPQMVVGPYGTSYANGYAGQTALPMNFAPVQMASFSPMSSTVMNATMMGSPMPDQVMQGQTMTTMSMSPTLSTSPTSLTPIPMPQASGVNASNVVYSTPGQAPQPSAPTALPTPAGQPTAMAPIPAGSASPLGGWMPVSSPQTTSTTNAMPMLPGMNGAPVMLQSPQMIESGGYVVDESGMVISDGSATAVEGEETIILQGPEMVSPAVNPSTVPTTAGLPMVDSF